MDEWIFRTIYSNYLDNADTEILMFFTKKEWSYPRKIEKSKILGTILELPAKGQLISKCPYEKSVWTKYQRKYFCP